MAALPYRPEVMFEAAQDFASLAISQQHFPLWFLQKKETLDKFKQTSAVEIQKTLPDAS